MLQPWTHDNFSCATITMRTHIFYCVYHFGDFLPKIFRFDKVRLPRRFVVKSRVVETGAKLETKTSGQEMSPGGNLTDRLEDKVKDMQQALQWIRQEIVCILHVSHGHYDKNRARQIND